MDDIRKDCPMRHENGNCLPAGGFCTAVNDPICESLHGAYDCGRFDLLNQNIAHGVTVQDWISVKDGLPKIYEKEPDWSVTVLFRTIQGHIHSGYRNIGRPPKSFYDDDWTPPYWLDESENLSFEENEVTHWQYLPKPPEGE